MAPFYTILALWVGALILVAIIHVKVEPEEGITDIKPYQAYFGRYILFFLIGQTKTLITVLEDLFYVRIQCHNPFLFWLAGAVSSFKLLRVGSDHDLRVFLALFNDMVQFTERYRNKKSNDQRNDQINCNRCYGYPGCRCGRNIPD